MVMVQFLRDASTAQFLFSLNRRINVSVELGFRVNKEGSSCDAAQLMSGSLKEETEGGLGNAHL